MSKTKNLPVGSGEYERGVASAEKLWAQALPLLLTEARPKHQYFECGHCFTRYVFDPHCTTYPELVLCPRCVRQHRQSVIGICRVVERDNSVSNYEFNGLKRLIEELLDQYGKLREMYKRRPSVRNMSLAQAAATDDFERMGLILDRLEEVRAGGWRFSFGTPELSSTSVQTLDFDNMPKPTDLEPYKPEKVTLDAA